MLKLTTIHLDEIEKYFLVSSEEEQLYIQQNIRPQYLSAFLTDLKLLFNSTISDEVKLISIAKSMGAEEHIERLKEIQRDYYTHLANMQLSGISNTDIAILIKNQNTSFLEELSFQQDFNTALVFHERQKLKNSFKEQDKQTDIQPEELELAFKLNERKRLKSLFQQIEIEQQIGKSAATAEMKVISFHWKKYAIAAAIIGLVSTTTFIIFNNKGNKDLVSNKQSKEPSNKQILLEIQQRERNNEVIQMMARETVPVNVKSINVLSTGFGFATVKKKLSVKIYNLAKRIDLLEMLNFKLDDTIRIKINTERELLKSKLNHYTFKNDTISIYLNRNTDVEIIATGNKYFMQLGSYIYECNPSKKLIPLQVVEDEATLEKVQRVLFKNNKTGK
jgi:hypothetical protein